MPTGNLALYVDVENTSNALIRGLEKLIRRVEQDYGRIVVREAFTCWSRHQAARDGLTELGFDLKEVNDLGQTGKNSADIHLVVDLLMTLAEREDITGVVIVSGDSDFGPLYRALRKSGRVVIGVLPGKHVALRVAQHSCTEVIPQEWLERSTGTPSRAASGPASVRPAPEAAPADPDRLRTEAIAAIDHALAAHGGRISLGNLRTNLGAAAAGLPKNNLVAWLRRNGDDRWEVEGPLAGNATLCSRGAPVGGNSGASTETTSAAPPSAAPPPGLTGATVFLHRHYTLVPTATLERAHESLLERPGHYSRKTAIAHLLSAGVSSAEAGIVVAHLLKFGALKAGAPEHPGDSMPLTPVLAAGLADAYLAHMERLARDFATTDGVEFDPAALAPLRSERPTG